MKFRAGSLVAFSLLLLSPFVCRAGDDPHGMTYIGTTGSTTSVNGSCQTCHATHKAAGSSLTRGLNNEALCTSCHNMGGIAARFPLEGFVKADPSNNLGTSHAWNASAESSAAGASTPLGAALFAHLDNGNVTCSTCHDQHKSGDPSAIAGGAAGSQILGTATRIAGAGSGTLSFTATATATPKAYLIEIIETAGNAGTARFRLSNDGGVSWFGYSAGVWTAYSPGNAQLTGAAVSLNDGANVVAAFTGAFAIGDRIRFYVGYPFLRAPLDSGDNTTGTKFCRDCHRSRAMDHVAVDTWDGTMKSHPVGITLNANGGGYDRATPLDGNGAPQSTGDGNSSNDLQLAADQTVQCLSCHAVHHAASSNTP